MESKYPKFDSRQLYKYKGDNPFILDIKKKYISDNNIELSVYENEYLIKNFRYCGYSFSRFKIDTGKKTEMRIQKEYNLDRPIPHAYIDNIVGETDEWLHTSCNTKNGVIYFWLYKEEVGNIYQKINQVNTSVDFEALNKYLHPKKLFPHQAEGIQYLVNQKKCLLYDTVGAGKTYTSIGGAIASGCKKVLIICLSGKKIDWRNELKVWGQESKIISGWNNWIDDEKRFTIINFDIIHKYNIVDNFDCVIVDEIQNIKSTSTKRSKTISAILAKESVKHVYGLSATPIEKNEDFFNICRNLNINIGDIIYTSSEYPYNEWMPKYEEFIVNYCHGFKVIPKNGKKPFWLKGKKINGITETNSNTYELHQRVKHKQRRVKTENVIENFPDKTRSRMWYDLSVKERKEYDKLFEYYLSASFIMRNMDKLLFNSLKDLQNQDINDNIDDIYNKNISNINNEINKAKKYPNGYHDMVNKYGENILLTINKAVEMKKDYLSSPSNEEIKNKTDLWFSNYIKTINLESSKELIETIFLRQYTAIKKVPHTIALVKNEIECGNNCIVFTNFSLEYEKLVEGLKDIAVPFKSGQTAEKKHATLAEFMNDDNKKVIIGNIKSLGTGLNITKADVVIFNSPNWGGGEHEQAEGRAWRIGRKDLVTVYYQIFEDTIEERVFNKAEEKKDNTLIFLGEDIEPTV